jgi:YD repeat-containing protein
VLAGYHYSWDLAAQLTSETDNGQTSTYQYDATGQLIAAMHSSQPNENYIRVRLKQRLQHGRIQAAQGFAKSMLMTPLTKLPVSLRLGSWGMRKRL